MPAPGDFSKCCHLGDILGSLLQFRDKEVRNSKVCPVLWLRTVAFLCAIFILWLISARVRSSTLKTLAPALCMSIRNCINIDVKRRAFTSGREAAVWGRIVLLMTVGILFPLSVHSLPSFIRAPHQIVGLNLFWSSKVTQSPRTHTSGPISKPGSW